MVVFVIISRRLPSPTAHHSLLLKEEKLDRPWQCHHWGQRAGHPGRRMRCRMHPGWDFSLRDGG